MDNVLCDGVGRSGFRTEDAYQWNGRLMTGFDFMILMDEVQQIQLLTFVFMQTLDWISNTALVLTFTF